MGLWSNAGTTDAAAAAMMSFVYLDLLFLSELLQVSLRPSMALFNPAPRLKEFVSEVVFVSRLRNVTGAFGRGIEVVFVGHKLLE